MNDASAPVASTPVAALVMRRDFSAERLNRVLADPDVRKWVSEHPTPPDALDATMLLADPRNVALMCDSGGALFVALDDPGTSHELHTQFLPAARGRPTVAFMHEALAYMFTHTNCLEVVTKVPSHNHAARALAHHFRFDLDAVRAEAWALEDGTRADVEYYGYRWSDWIRHSPLLAAMGQAFHDRLDSECERLGAPFARHAPESWHDRVVGATLATSYAGLVDKACILYNRWARFAGYAPVGVVSRVPPVVEFPGMRLVLDPARATFEVVPLPRPRQQAPEAGVL
jgi:hypothetical protein